MATGWQPRPRARLHSRRPLSHPPLCAHAAHFNLTPNGRDIASAAAAVTASYLVIALYSCHAIAEADEGSNGSKKES